MFKPIDIIAIHDRTAEGNGVSRPFRCEGEDGCDYFVKLKNAGYECLVKEWVAGRLAQEMGLPVAGMKQVRISPGLIAGKTEFMPCGCTEEPGSPVAGASWRDGLAMDCRVWMPFGPRFPRNGW